MQQISHTIKLRVTAKSATAQLEKGINVALNKTHLADESIACKDSGAHEANERQKADTRTSRTEELCIQCGLYW